MYTADLRITAQYQENYGDSTTPYWKMKGGVEFIIKGIEPDPVLYAAPGEATAFNVIGRALVGKTTVELGTVEAIVTIN